MYTTDTATKMQYCIAVCIIYCFNQQTMKLKIWIGPLIVVIILLTLRQMIDNLMQDEKQQSDIHAVKKQPSASADWRVLEAMPVLILPMTGTRLHTDTLPF
jgi:c-di-AMP phosphodiesterase-like protein